MEFSNSRPSNAVNVNALAQLFQQTYEEALRKNEENRKNWIRQKEDHITLRTQLGSLPDTLSQDVMVPIGSRALMKGKIVHTNEILVCLGAGWFAKQSAKCATEICNRRIMLCNEMLTNLNKERELLSSRMQLPVDQEVFKPDEIIEICNEEDEAKWKVRHKEKEREYRQRLKEHRDEEELSKNNEELWNILERLELQEELQQELDAFHDEQEEHENPLDHQSLVIPEPTSSDIFSTLPEEHASKLSEELILQKSIPFNNGKPLTEINNAGIGDNASSSKEQPALVLEPSKSSELSNELLDKHSPKRRVSFVEENSFAEADDTDDEESDSSDEPLCIKFRHTASLGQSPRLSSISADQVQTPADIYNIVPKIVPKSILKQRSHDSNLNVGETEYLYRSSFEQTDYDSKGSEEVAHETDFPLAFGDVIEHSTEEITNNVQELHSKYKRPVSRFRANRQTTT